ncbi:hypothetical protein C5S39_12665 [Candidatus Methanophagaceae archaeon]|nr:hypothetical protein C5S39_12665 [Methanophagales archaeon]
MGFVNILEDMKVEKRSKCVYTPLQISLAYIVKMILGFKNAYRAIIQWMRILGLVTGVTVACNSTKMRVDGLTYEGAEEVFDYQKKENVRVTSYS